MFSLSDTAWFCVSLAIGWWILHHLICSTVLRRRLSSNGKAVFITGCDSGFGYLLAQRLARLRYKVFAGCLLVDGKGAEELRSFSNIKVFHLDVTNDQSVENAAKIVSEELADNELWTVVNNAGILHCSEMEWTALQTILNVFNVNTFGMVRVTKQLLPFLKKSKGRIINVTSIAAERLITGSIGYSMSKAAAKSFNDVIRVELKKWGIKVINIAPYYYSTKITDVDNMAHIYTEAWNRSDPETRACLGDEYLDEYLKFIKRYMEIMNNPRVNEVVDCMEDAITSSSPKICYRPGDVINKLAFDVIIYLPTSLQDYFQTQCLPSIKRRS